MTDERRLGYKDRFTDYLRSVIDDSSPRSLSDELSLSAETQFLVLEVTREQYTRLFASAMTGADLVYPEIAHDVLWPLWRAAGVANFCDAVANCIDGSENVQVSIINQTTGNPSGVATGNATTPITENERAEDMLSASFTCDRDHAFATARAIVEGIHEATSDIMEQVDLATAPIDVVALIADEIPLVSLLGMAVETVLWIKDTAFLIYEAAWSDITRDNIACEIFCVLIDDPGCSISFDQIKSIYQDIGYGDAPPTDLAHAGDWLDWLYGLPLAINTGAVKAGGMLGIISMFFGAKFGKLGIGHRSLETLIALAADETSNDWEILCTECPDDWHMVGNLEGAALPAYITVVNGNHQEAYGVRFVCHAESGTNLTVGRIGVEHRKPPDDCH